MAWEARLGLKLLPPVLTALVVLGLNGLGSPSGIETHGKMIHPSTTALAKWPGKPVWDSYENSGEGGNQEKGARSEPSGERWEQEHRLTRLTRLGKHLRLLFQHDLVTQGLQAAHGGVALTSRVQRLEEVRAQIMVVLVGPQHLVDDGQEAVADGHDGALLAHAAGQAMVLGREIGLLGVGNDPDDLGQHGAQVRMALGGGGPQALAATLLVARSDPSPGSQMLGRRKATHVRADLSQDGRRGQAPAARDLHEAREKPFVGSKQLVDLISERVQLALQEVDEVEQVTRAGGDGWLPRGHPGPRARRGAWRASVFAPGRPGPRHR